jgi:XTP/dITP diphosphohydrolase
MENPTPLVIATRNAGKAAEFRDLLRQFPVQIKTLADFGPIPEAEESGSTFEENAYLKASLTARVLGVPALADDSGLLIDALNGAPGVHSARFAGPDATDIQRCEKILHEMQGAADRRASFECVLSIAVPTGAALTYTGRCEGRIAEQPAGRYGFGYDPIFYYPPLGRTFAQLTRQEKSRVSHRGKALQELHSEFTKVLIWIEQQMPRQQKFVCQHLTHD